MLLRRILFAPITLLLGMALKLRHALYDSGVFRRTRPTVPTIAIGNLALGGTGKTPLLELVLRVLEGVHPVATLSRGYGREGTDIHEVKATDSAALSGDEPVQVKRHFPDARVFVGADRVAAIVEIQRALPDVRAVVLDDALQHRALDAGLNILLTTWQRPYCDDALVPAGRLRDLRDRAAAAQAVVVTKCPALPDLPTQQRWRHRLGLRSDQHLFFAGIAYDRPTRISTGAGQFTHEPLKASDLAANHALLVTGIADPALLLAHVSGLVRSVSHASFPDHHAFSAGDMEDLAGRMAKFAAGPRMLITTEKDAVRLMPLLSGGPWDTVPVVVVGMQAVILNEPERFADLIRHHVAPHPAHR
ncbi:MAG: tetraacyldisaccharide 4'-kinase [Flavobacteriales bacterium]|nr:tetraacyldisaccharide 4'-kinase [Flavobacteriales bacterium]